MTSLGQSELFGYLIVRGPWYGLIFFGLAIIIIFPVALLEEIGRIKANWKHVIWLEAIAWSILIGGNFILMHFHRQLHWWVPLVFVLGVGIWRLFAWAICHVSKSESGEK